MAEIKAEIYKVKIPECLKKMADKKKVFLEETTVTIPKEIFYTSISGPCKDIESPNKSNEEIVKNTIKLMWNIDDLVRDPWIPRNIAKALTELYIWAWEKNFNVVLSKDNKEEIVDTAKEIIERVDWYMKKPWVDQKIFIGLNQLLINASLAKMKAEEALDKENTSPKETDPSCGNFPPSSRI